MRVMLSLGASLLLVAAIVTVAVGWCRLSHLRLAQGAVLYEFSPAHGVHTVDLVALGTELVLLLILTGTMYAGFSRGTVPENARPSPTDPPAATPPSGRGRAARG